MTDEKAIKEATDNIINTVASELIKWAELQIVKTYMQMTGEDKKKIREIEELDIPAEEKKVRIEALKNHSEGVTEFGQNLTATLEEENRKGLLRGIKKED